MQGILEGIIDHHSCYFPQYSPLSNKDRSCMGRFKLHCTREKHTVEALALNLLRDDCHLAPSSLALLAVCNYLE